MVDVNVWTNRLIGRDRELAALGSLLDGALVDGATLLLTGEPGVGKTALLAAAAEMAANAGFAVIRGGGVEYETDVSFAGLHQLVGPLFDDLPRLPRSSRVAMEVALGIGSGPAPERLAVLNASLALFRQAASRSPLLIVIDDLHWLDRASGAVVGFVGRRLRGNRVGMLGAMRPGVGGFFERAGLPEYDVSPLSEAAAMGLLARQFVHLPARVLRRVADEAQGNPLALLEFAASAGGPRNGGQRRTTVTSGMSREVRALYDARIERLPEPTRHLLLLAVLDGSGDLGVLAVANGPRGLADLGPAERDHLIVVDDRAGELRFRHPMIRSVAVERSTHDERRDAHLRLAELFSDQPERRGYHLAEAAFAPDEDIAAAVEDAAHRTLQRGDVVGAISRLLKAADLSPDPTGRSRRLADAAYVGAHSAGQLDSASELLRDAHRRDPTLGETLHAAAATAYLLLNSDGNAETTHRLLTVAIESALGEPDQDHDGFSEGLYTLVLVCHYAGRTEYWVPFHDAMSRLGATAPADVRLLAETFADPVTASDQALSELDYQIEQLRSTEDDALIIRTAIAGFYADRLPGCREALMRVVRDGREGGAVGTAMMALLMLAFDELNVGRWDNAHQLAAEATAMCEERGYRLYEWSGRYAMALAVGNRGDREACRDICEAMIEWGAPRQLGRLADWAHHALARAALSTGDFEGCYAYASAISPPGTLSSHNPQALWAALDLIDAAAHTGRNDQARAHADVVRRAHLGRLSPRFALITAAAGAMVASDDEAPGLFGEALALPGIEEWPFELARVQLALGERLRRLRRTRDARSHLAAARGGFERLGALPWARRAATELGATGATRQRVTGGGACLTLQEHEVAQLAATGMTNREIAAKLYMSPRTVSAHLYRIFPKLGITARAALRDALNAVSSDAAR
ncbi:MAG TPA: AAA family ATPase [Streptosporangiaceae bacterium]|nr:AAA family ATPase [Streptosporangiaceae bacterium]